MKKLFSKKENNKSNRYRNNSKSNSSFNINIFPINSLIFGTHMALRRNTVINKANIPNRIFKINAQGLNFGFLVTIGNIIAAPNQPAERLINRSESACNQSITFPVYHNFSGQIDDVRVYNYALTATQVKLLMNDGAIRFGPSTGSP